MCKSTRSLKEIISLEELGNIVPLTSMDFLHKVGLAFSNESAGLHYYPLQWFLVQCSNEPIIACLWMKTTKTIHFCCLGTPPLNRGEERGAYLRGGTHFKFWLIRGTLI